jgi:hypothetical protein
MSEISNIPPSPSLPPRTEIRETQPEPAGAQLSQVEEEVFNENANTLATHRAATSIFGRPQTNFIYRSNPGFGRGQHTELLQAQRNAFAQPTAPTNQHSEFIQAQRNAYNQYSAPFQQIQEDPFEGSVHSYDNRQNARNFGARFLAPHVAEAVGPPAGGTFPLLDQAWTGFASPAQYPANANNLSRADYMQVSHIQEVVRQIESASYYLEAGAATLPADNDAGTNIDMARMHLNASDNAAKTALDIYAAVWEHGRAAPAVLDLQNQQNRTYNPTPGRHTAAAQTTELFIQKKLFTNACNNIAPRVPPPASRSQNRNGAAGGAAKGGHRGNTAPTPAAAGTQTANRPRRQPAGASAAPNPPHVGRGGGQPDSA